MRRTLILLFIFPALLLSSLPSDARDYNLPPGKWWENDRVVEHLRLTEDQQAEIGDLVYESATRMIDLNAAVEKAKLALENQVDRRDLDAAAVRQAFKAFQDARRALETERFEMLLAVRVVLTPEQWEKMLSMREKLDRMRQRRDGPPPPGRRPPGRFPPGGGPGGEGPGGPRS